MNIPSEIYLHVTDSMTSEIAAKVVSVVVPALAHTLGKNTAPQAKENQAICQENAELRERIAHLEQEVSSLKELVQELAAKQSSPRQAEPEVEPEPVKEDRQDESPGRDVSDCKAEPDEEKAELWVRENLAKWLDNPCPFKKASGRTWRELAENQGCKISMNGKGERSPRAYLHAIESWAKCNVWDRIKAKVALEVGKNGQSSRNHLAAISG